MLLLSKLLIHISIYLPLHGHHNLKMEIIFFLYSLEAQCETYKRLTTGLIPPRAKPISVCITGVKTLFNESAKRVTETTLLEKYRMLDTQTSSIILFNVRHNVYILFWRNPRLSHNIYILFWRNPRLSHNVYILFWRNPRLSHNIYILFWRNPRLSHNVYILFWRNPRLSHNVYILFWRNPRLSHNVYILFGIKPPI